MTDTVIGGIMANRELPGLEKRARIYQAFAERGDQGPASAVACIEGADDEALTDYVAQYLALVPGHASEKTKAAELLRGKGPLVRSASWLVPWLPEKLLNEFVSDYLADPRPDSPVGNVIYCAGIYFPALLRPVADRLESDVQRALLSGAPNILADAFLDRWRETGDLGQLEALALIRTDYAADRIASVRDEIEEVSDWAVLAQLSGRLADSGTAACRRPACMGFIVDPGDSKHVVGGRYEGSVPICLECQAPAERVLALAAGDLPFPLANNPAFFWYSCGCEALDSTTVRIGPDGLTVFPNWVTIDRHPRCPECGQDMPFVASIGGGSTLYGDLGFEGHLYCFWCDGCRVSSTQYQE